MTIVRLPCLWDAGKVPLTQEQFDALVDFVFDLGSGRLASSTLLTVLVIPAIYVVLRDPERVAV